MNLNKIFNALDTIERQTEQKAKTLKAAFNEKVKTVEHASTSYSGAYKERAIKEAESKFVNARNEFRTESNSVVKQECADIRRFIDEAYSKPITSEQNNFLNSLQLRSELNEGDIEAAKLTIGGNPLAMLSFNSIVSRTNPSLASMLPFVPSLDVVHDAIDDYEQERYTAIQNYLNVPEGTQSVSLHEEFRDPMLTNPSNLHSAFMARVGRSSLEKIIKPLEQV